MEDTACGCDCPLVKSGICKSDRECPNFIESWWKEGEQGHQKLIKDCAPRRVMLQQANTQHALIGVQASVCELREKISCLINIFANLSTCKSADIEEVKSIERLDNSHS